MLGGFNAENPITLLCCRKSHLTYFLFYHDPFLPFTIQFLRRYPLYKPLKILLELVILDDSCVPRDETQDKALNEIEKWVLQAGRLSPISALERNGRVIRGEICWRLARRKSRGHPSQLRLIEKGTKNALDAMKTMKRDGQYAYMMKTAYVVSAPYSTAYDECK